MTITFQSIPWGVIGMLVIAGFGLAKILDCCFDIDKNKDDTLDK